MKSIDDIVSETIKKCLLFEGEGEKYDPYSDPYNQVKYFHDPKVNYGEKWAKNGGNFAVERNGKVYYVSRSVAVSAYVYCFNPQGELCVLANKRGPGAPNNQGKWNVVCGYLDYNENLEYAAIREVYEETGVRIPYGVLKMMGINSNGGVNDEILNSYHDKNAPIGELGRNTPVTAGQNVSVRFACVLRGTTDDYPIDTSGCEPGEVDDARWVPLSQVRKMSWAFGHGHSIYPQAQTLLGNDLGVKHGKYDIHKLSSDIRHELRNNPKALYMFNQLMIELKKKQGR